MVVDDLMFSIRNDNSMKAQELDNASRCEAAARDMPGDSLAQPDDGLESTTRAPSHVRSWRVAREVRSRVAWPGRDMIRRRRGL